mmetsp:Transcript_23552/g.51535  ORF Transcript_23552/g.51535 Transcript_23552/m.51535 type:complete len:93 (+) Transcript_23552:2620-2898(+)
MELILSVVRENLPKHMWFGNFAVEPSGDPSRVNVLYQDHKSTILLQNNGILSRGKGSKHVHTRYFFVTEDQTKEIYDAILGLVIVHLAIALA